MKYILNDSIVKTTNGFGINNIALDLDVPFNYDFNDFDINSEIEIKTNKKGKGIKTGIGLDYNTTYAINVTILQKSEKPIIISYSFKNNDVLISDINIKYESNSEADIIFKFNSENSNKNYNHININVDSSKDSKGSISIINLLNDKSYNFIDIKGNINGEITYNIIDLDGTRVSRIINELDDNSICNLNSIYVGNNNDLIDVNYYMKNKGKNSISNINTQGVLAGDAIKHFKGVIDFISGSSKSIGKEIENVILLSDTAISKSLPMLLCGEEDVEGAHGVSTGKIDKDKLFYLMSRGLSKEESENLIIEGNLNKVLTNIPDSNVIDEIIDYIKKKCR